MAQINQQKTDIEVLRNSVGMYDTYVIPASPLLLGYTARRSHGSKQTDRVGRNRNVKHGNDQRSDRKDEMFRC
ncbi:uncharacterized protein MELLADRAFT_90011 [Melampsora larici-populina 98AG31]|uniref:Uncharacterized protein n=1 Tax=Melampsora larici-populina (strain 98AG31 / pathotype 3-4-7) TaxID=747676 RepID=F4RVE9_MELLP|nr:uncharacterized protein MELLADRAFT_90011 [Melampsora larici-populina 98AG31]EGG03682.1 hypothetical protein MELLADRAFT_90011 [Melampsora larici-populina 98AG31]